MRFVTILLLGFAITDCFPAAASPIEPSVSDRHWTRSDRILLSVRRQLLSPAHLDATKEDRTGLWTFYAGRANGPVWVTETGWTPRALAVIEEIKRAGDWGLDPGAFDIPMLSGAPELTDRAVADAEMRLSLAVLKYARQARGGRIEDPATQLTPTSTENRRLEKHINSFLDHNSVDAPRQCRPRSKSSSQIYLCS